VDESKPLGGGGGGGFDMTSEGAAASIRVAAYDTRSNLTIAVANNGDNNTNGADVGSTSGGGSSLVLRSDASGPAAVRPSRYESTCHRLQFNLRVCGSFEMRVDDVASDVCQALRGGSYPC